MSAAVTTIEERIKQQEEKLKQLKALKQKQEARIRAAQSKKERADDTRRKVLAGALLLEIMNESAENKNRFTARLDKFLTRPVDRALFGLPEFPTKPGETS